MISEIVHQLRGEGDFWHEQNDRFAGGELSLGELEVNVGFAAAGDAMQKDGVRGVVGYGTQRPFLGGIERDGRVTGGVSLSEDLVAASFGDAAR